MFFAFKNAGVRDALNRLDLRDLASSVLPRLVDVADRNHVLLSLSLSALFAFSTRGKHVGLRRKTGLLFSGAFGSDWPEVLHTFKLLCSDALRHERMVEFHVFDVANYVRLAHRCDLIILAGMQFLLLSQKAFLFDHLSLALFLLALFRQFLCLHFGKLLRSRCDADFASLAFLWHFLRGLFE